MGNNKTLERTHELSNLIRRYPHLPTRWLGALMGTTKYHKVVLSKYRKAKLVTNHPRSFAYRKPAHPGDFPKLKEFCWQLTPSALALDRGNDFIPAGPHFEHQWLSSMVAASFELATKEIPNLTLVYPHHILLHYECPSNTRELNEPWFPETSLGVLEPDSPVFGLDYNGARTFFVLEIDRNTTHISGEQKSAIETKLRKYEAYFDEDVPMYMYGLRTDQLRVLFVCTREQRMRHIKDMAARYIPDNVLFMTHPDFTDGEAFPLPNSRMVTEDWYTTSGTFNILTHLKQKEAKREQRREGSRAEATV